LASLIGSLGISIRAEDEIKQFTCRTSFGRSETIVVTNSNQEVIIIDWSSSESFAESKTSSEACGEATKKLNEFHDEGVLAYFTTGRVGGSSVICVSAQDGGPCRGILVVLRKGRDPVDVLNSLLGIESSLKGSLKESLPRVYVKIDNLIQRRP